MGEALLSAFTLVNSILLCLLLVHVEIYVRIYQIQIGAKDHGLVINQYLHRIGMSYCLLILPLIAVALL